MADIILVEGSNELNVEIAPLPIEFIPIQVVDLDVNDNGIVDGEDEAAFLGAYPSMEGDPNYDRQFDANFDGAIDDRDRNIFYNTLGKRLEVIRNSVKPGIYQYLVWPDGWDAYLVALNKDMVEEFTGRGLTKDGWISVQHHPYILVGYSCGHFAAETALAAYKALGYGCLLRAWSGDTRFHGYNIFWVGGDWHNLNNWYVLEPQSGRLIGPAGSENLPSVYHTRWIEFWDYVETKLDGKKKIYIYLLNVDYEAKKVSFGAASYTSNFWLYPLHGKGFEEPVPDLLNRAFMI